MSHIFSAGHRCPVRTNPKSETRNPKQARNSNDKFSNPESARPRRLGFEDLLLYSLEFVSDFGFRISDFARHSCQTGGGQQRKIKTRFPHGERAGVRGEASRLWLCLCVLLV